MTLTRKARLFAAVTILAAVACGWIAQHGIPLQTNLLSMLPPTERDRFAEDVANKIGAVMGRRVLFVVSHEDDASARRGAEEFARALRADGTVRAFARLNGVGADLPVKLYASHRFGLLSEQDRAALASAAYDLREAALREVLLPVPYPKLLPLAADPFGFFNRWMASIDVPLGRLRLEDGYLVAHEAGRTHVLVAGEIAGDAYDDTMQQRAVVAYERALAEVRAGLPGVAVARSGAVFHAAAARGSAKRDMERIALGSVAGVALLMFLAFRSLQPLLLGLLSAAIGILFATLVVLLTDGELQLICVAFGASLIGEAVDYSIFFFSAHLAAGGRWTPEEGIADVRPGLTVAVATSLLAYALLALLPFPGVSQIARFALVGLGVAYLCVIWLLPALMVAPTRRDAVRATAWAAALLEWWRSALRRPVARWIALGVCIAAIPGWLRLHSNDDVRLLIAQDATLAAEAASIRAITGFAPGGRFFLVRGMDEDQVLERDSALAERLRQLQRSGDIGGFQAVSNAVPPGSQQQHDRALLARSVFGDAPALRHALAEVGLPPKVAAQLTSELQHAPLPLSVADWLASPLSAPLRYLWRPVEGGAFASVVIPYGERDVARLAQAAANLEGVTLVDKPGSVSALLGRYRTWALPGLAAAACAILLVLLVRYGAQDALRLMLPVVLAEMLSASIFGYIGEPVTIFAVGGWMLTLGIGVNYAIFLREGAHRGGATAMAVLLAGATTALAWGLLSLSEVPALRQFGLALLTGIAVAVVLAPLGTRAHACAA